MCFRYFSLTGSRRARHGGTSGIQSCPSVAQSATIGQNLRELKSQRHANGVASGGPPFSQRLTRTYGMPNVALGSPSFRKRRNRDSINILSVSVGVGRALVL